MAGRIDVIGLEKSINSDMKLEVYNQGYHAKRHKYLIEDEEYFWARAEASTRLYFTPEERQKRIFEYGCGIGQGIAMLPHAAGWDISAEALSACRKRGLKVYDRFESVPRKSWDIVFCRHVLEHVESPLLVLRALRELLVDDGGELYLILPKEKHYKSPLGPDLDQHLYCWNFRAINNLLNRAGFIPYRNYVKYVLGYRFFLPIRRALGANAYYLIVRLAGWLKRNGELVIRARLSSEVV